MKAPRFEAPVGCEPGERRRADIVQRREGKRILAGFHERASQSVVDVATCVVARPRINAALAPLRSAMAAILRDPYPVHWDRDANAVLGLGGRVINQGPLNLGYLVNMLLAWAGPSCVRRLTVSFGRPVLDGDTVTAGQTDFVSVLYIHGHFGCRIAAVAKAGNQILLNILLHIRDQILHGLGAQWV